MKEKEERLIQIPLEEYKELLIIKGRYEELVKKEIILPKEEKKIPEKLEDYYLDKKGKYPIELTI